MSRIGNRPIKIEDGVTISITPSKVTAVSGANKLDLFIPSIITVKQEDQFLIVNRKDDTKESRSQHGLIARLLKNIITGVKDGFIKELTYTGTGYRIAINGNEVVLNMGYSHEIKLPIPEGISVEMKKNNISVKGIDKAAVGQFAALIREVRGPEVYKGKGIKYKTEIIKRKAGKKASA